MKFMLKYLMIDGTRIENFESFTKNLTRPQIEEFII